MKTKIYILIFVILLAFAGYTLLNSNTYNSAKEKAFKIENFEDVTEIKISNRNTKNVHFKKQNDEWILNDKYPVREHLFTEMKEALTKMEAQSPVPRVGTDAVLTQMLSGALKVEVYKGSKLDKVIHIGGPNLTNTASHMFLEIDGKASQQIYNVGIPGFRGFLTTRFVVDEDEWRAKNIFSYLPNDIKKIEVKYFNNSPYDDYILEKKTNDFSVSIEDKEYLTSELNEASIVNYLIKLEGQEVLNYSFTKPNEMRLKDSLLRVNKYAELTITDIKNETGFVTIVDMPLNEGSKQQYDAYGDPMKYDIDYKYIIFGENEDWGVITNNKFGLILTNPDNFLKMN